MSYPIAGPSDLSTLFFLNSPLHASQFMELRVTLAPCLLEEVSTSPTKPTEPTSQVTCLAVVDLLLRITHTLSSSNGQIVFFRIHLRPKTKTKVNATSILHKTVTFSC
jgi:hypothetical protein